MALYNMKEILADAQARGYGVGFFNTINMEMIHACIAAAEELDSPIIIGTAESLLPIAPFEWIAPAMLDAARRARVPVAVNRPFFMPPPYASMVEMVKVVSSSTSSSTFTVSSAVNMVTLFSTAQRRIS